MAQTLIEAWSDDKFDFSQYEDSRRKRVQELIKAKVRGHETVEREEAAEDEPEVLNLMDALKKSVDAGRSKKGGRKRR